MKRLLVLLTLCLSFGAFAQPFKPDISGRVSGDAFRNFCKNRHYSLVGTFDSLPYPAKTMAAEVIKNGAWIYVDINGKEFSNHDELAKHYGFYQEPENFYENWDDDDIGPYEDPGELMPVPEGAVMRYTGTYEVNGKVGYKINNKVIIQPKYNHIQQLWNTDDFLFFSIEDNGFYGICDFQGKVIIPTIYSHIEALNYGSRECYFIATKNKQHTALSRGGIVTVPLQYDQLLPQRTGKDFVLISRKNGLSGIISSTGKTILEPMYPDIKPAQTNPANGFIITVNGKSGYLNRAGQIKIPTEYKSLFYNENDFLTYQVDKLLGALDTNGTKILEPLYSEIVKPKTGNCFIATITENNVKRTGIYSLKGEVIEEPKFGAYAEYGLYYKDNEMYLFAKEKLYEETGLYNIKTLQWLLPCEYKLTTISSDFLIASKKDSTRNNVYGIINAAGSLSIPCIYRQLEYNNIEKLAVVSGTDGKYGVVNANNKLLLPFSYESLYSLTDPNYTYGERKNIPKGYLVFSQNGSKGVINTTGKITIPARYDEINATDFGLICISGDTSSILSADGKQLNMVPHPVYWQPEGYFTWYEKQVMYGIDVYGNKSTVPAKPVLRGPDFYPPGPKPVEEKFKDTNVVYTVVDEPAFFPGGHKALVPFLVNNMNYPESALENGIQGKCYLTFVVERDGSITDIQILRKLVDCPECEQEAVRVIKLMPKWNPAILNGQPVRSQFNLPVVFKDQ